MHICGQKVRVGGGGGGRGASLYLPRFEGFHKCHRTVFPEVLESLHGSVDGVPSTSPQGSQSTSSTGAAPIAVAAARLLCISRTSHQRFTHI